ncbi:MAG: alpha/beta fold hydrolase [Stackebrandtia sp.]
MPSPPTTATGSENAHSLTTDDGLRLHVEVEGAVDAPVTVVLTHGWTQSLDTWRHQVRHLCSGAVGSIQVVRYDHRGHGRSEATSEAAATIENLAHDLSLVIDTYAPEGPLVLAGHSMGAMAMMGLAEHRPDLFADRVAGAVFVSTAAGHLDRVTLGLPAPMGARLRARLPRLLATRARMLSRRTRARPPAIESQVVRRFLLGRPVRPADHQIVLRDLVSTPADSMCGFFGDLMRHDRTAALSALDQVPTRILVGDRDRLTAPSHARWLARSMPWAELVVLRRAGHMLPLERDAAVTSNLAELVRATRPQAARGG